jgi:hypothetical protein
MATKTAGGSMYSGLLQTNQELAKAKELESNALSIGLEQGAKPLQRYLMGLANEEKERENQLKKGQELAIDNLNKMSDTSSLLGDFDTIITSDAQTTKDLLNNIAKDESLSQYEKAAKYKEAVDSFNKKVARYSADQELIAGITGKIAKGNISGGVDITGDNYKIAQALSSGNFKIQGDKYIIEGLQDSNVDSNRLKNLTIAEKTFDANKVSGSIAALGSATTNREDLKRDLQEYALNVGDIETARSLLIDGNLATRKDLEGKDLLGLQTLIAERGYKIADKAFIAAKPAAIKLSDGQIMGKDSYALLENSISTSDFSNFIGGEINPGESISGFQMDGNKVKFLVVKKGSDDDPVVGATYNLNDIGQKVALGKILIDHTKATAGESLKALNQLRNMYFQPTGKDPDKKVDPIVDDTKTGLPEYFNTFSSDVPNQLKNENGEVIKSKSKEDNYVRSVLNVTGSASMGSEGRVIADMVRSDYNGVFSEANIRKAAYELNYEGTDSEGRPFGKSYIEAADLANQSFDANQKVTLLAIDSANDQDIDLDTRKKLRNKLTDIQTALNTNKSLSELTNKDIAIYNYIKAGGQLSNYETALADLKKEKDDNLNSLEV